MTLYKNGASTGSSCTIGNSQTGCTISGLSLAVNGTSDTIVLVVNRTAGTSYTGNASASISTNGSWGSGNWYASVSVELREPDGGELHTTPPAGTITSATFSFGSAIGATSSYSVTLYKNGASTGSSCTIGNSQTGCTISGLNVAVNGTSDTVVLVLTRTSGTDELPGTARPRSVTALRRSTGRSRSTSRRAPATRSPPGARARARS